MQSRLPLEPLLDPRAQELAQSHPATGGSCAGSSSGATGVGGEAERHLDSAELAPEFRPNKVLDPMGVPFPSLAHASAGWPVFSRLFSLILTAEDPQTLIHRAAVGVGLLPEVRCCEIAPNPCAEKFVVQCAFAADYGGFPGKAAPRQSELKSNATPKLDSGPKSKRKHERQEPSSSAPASKQAWLVVKLHPNPNSAVSAVVGDLLRLIVGFYDQARQMQRLSEEALSDPLTRLWNRRGFAVQLEQALSRFRRNHERLAVLCFDVDHFKSINDESGHATGDRSLSIIANAIREVCRPSDVPARLGGDEFTILLCSCDAQGAILVARRLQKAIDRANPLTCSPPTSASQTLTDAQPGPLLSGSGQITSRSGRPVVAPVPSGFDSEKRSKARPRRITLSIGIADSRLLVEDDPCAEASFQPLLDAADEALYAAKQSGRATVRVHPRCQEYCHFDEAPSQQKLGS